MIKVLSISFLILGLSGGSIIKAPTHSQNVELLIANSARSDFWSKWGPDIMEFLELIDIDQAMGVFIQYLFDPEVLGFLDFLLSPKFKEVVWNFESMEEFQEAVEFLVSKGYDVESVMNFINSIFDLPPSKQPRKLLRKGSGMSGLIEDIVATLPLEEMKKLFERKLETNAEFAELFETINSEEFMDIMRRMAQNPKFAEIKGIFEGHGFDFKYLCRLAKEIFGEYYQGIFCE